MKIGSAEAARPHGLENAIQRVQANMDRRAARSKAGGDGGHVPGANALSKLQANLGRKLGEPGVIDPPPPEPTLPGDGYQTDSILPAPTPTPEPTPTPTPTTTPTTTPTPAPFPAPSPEPDPNTGAGSLLDLLA